jgi:hypothetical protein
VNTILAAVRGERVCGCPAHGGAAGWDLAKVSKIFNATVVSVAMGDTTTLFLHEGNTISHTDHLPRGLNSALYDRPPDAPPPTVSPLRPCCS